MQIYPRLDTEKTLNYLLIGHLQAEHGYTDSEIHGRVASQTQSQGCLPHTGTGRQDDEVPRLEPRCQVVEVGKPTVHAGDGALPVVSPFDLLEGLMEHCLDRLEPLREFSLREAEDLLLRPVDELVDLATTLKGTL